ncbi:hypothetical protein PEBR_16046 [Penicillium brasilianum]|uniref:Uncharacterized protein n=1 Tax=Penicillium brasilianum TaxID=104259 RepID=A0A1S9RQQ2_PENBI|nr:hypothetical protein PEBR_16046 [Penicillium brasilianum]
MTSAIFGDANSGLQVGNNSGSITAEIHLAPQPQEPTPGPLSTVPFPRDPDFVDRGTLLDDIHIISSSLASRAALVGIGGVGKSQLAIEYCYRFLDESPKRWAFWIHASSAARFKQGCQSIIERVKIPSRNDSKVHPLNLLSNWLCDEKRGKWVLVLDNVDDDQFLEENTQSGQPLSAQLPLSTNGTIIITTRSREVASRFVEDRNIIDIEPMTEQDAVTLFEKKLGLQAEKEAITELIAALDLMPLAIVQAAAYIKERAPRCSVQQYLEQFRKGDRKRTRLLEKEGGRHRRDWEAKNSIMVTWYITFDHLRQMRRSAADLLSLMSFFDRQGIPEYCLRSRNKTRYKSDSDPSQEAADTVSLALSIDDDDFEEDILKLRSFSFIATTSDPATFQMHRLVQLATRNWLESHGQFNRWKQLCVKTLSIEFPTENFGTDNWSKAQSLYPHAELAMTQYLGLEDFMAQYLDLNDCLNDLFILAFKASRFAKRTSDLDDEIRWKGAIQTQKKFFGPEDPRALPLTVYLGVCYRKEGRLQAAEELLAPAVDYQHRLLGDDHPDTLFGMHSLAEIYQEQNRLQEAEALYQRIFTTQKNLLRGGHSETLSGGVKLARMYQKQDRLQDAEDLLKVALEELEKALGAEHPHTLEGMNSLAGLYRDQRRYQEAQPLYMRVIDTGNRVHGAGHIITIWAMGHLATTHMEQDSWPEAEAILIEATKTCKSKFGEENFATLMMMSLLASVYGPQGRWEEAESLYVQLLHSHKSVHGNDDPMTLASMHDLAWVWCVIGRDEDALKMMAQCVDMRTKILGPDHPDTKECTKTLMIWRMNNLDIGEKSRLLESVKR